MFSFFVAVMRLRTFAHARWSHTKTVLKWKRRKTKTKGMQNKLSFCFSELEKKKNNTIVRSSETTTKTSTKTKQIEGENRNIVSAEIVENSILNRIQSHWKCFDVVATIDCAQSNGSNRFLFICVCAFALQTFAHRQDKLKINQFSNEISSCFCSLVISVGITCNIRHTWNAKHYLSRH